jgi:MoxR-like ATPase
MVDFNKIIQDAVKDTTEAIIKDNIKKYINELGLFTPTVINIKNQEPKEIDKVVHNRMSLVLNLVSNDIPVWLVGEAGTGKTQLAEDVALSLELPFYPISVCAQTTASSLYGYMNAAGTYVGTHFREAYEHGGVFLMDEIDNGNANVISVLNSALSNGYCSFPDKIVVRHKDFRLIASGNTYGTGADRMYLGRNELDAATLDRFAFVEVTYDENIEFAAITNKNIVDLLNSVRAKIKEQNIRHIVSTRAGIFLYKLLSAGVDFDTAINVALLKNLSQQNKIVLTKENKEFSDIKKDILRDFKTEKVKAAFGQKELFGIDPAAKEVVIDKINLAVEPDIQLDPAKIKKLKEIIEVKTELDGKKKISTKPLEIQQKEFEELFQ